MKIKQSILTIFIVLIYASVCFGSNKYYYGRHPKLECSITPLFSELPTGEIASFAITLRNKSDKPVELNYGTGQEWDLVIINNKQQIYRYSSNFKWEERPFSHYLKPGASKTTTLSWKAVNRFNSPALQGIYTARGIAMLEPQRLVSADCSFRIFPPSIIKTENYKVKLNQLFEIKVPAHDDKHELSWRFEIKHNNNRLGLRNIKRDKEQVTFLMHPKRLGYIDFNLIACPTIYKNDKSVEKRRYHIEIVADLDD